MNVRSLVTLALGSALLAACPGTGPGVGPAIGSPTANAYCRLAPAIRALVTPDADGIDYTSPDEVRTFYEQASASADEALAAAPQDIRADVEVLVNDLRSLVAALEATSYDFAQAVEAYTPSAEHDAAQRRVEEYERDVCGIG